VPCTVADNVQRAFIKMAFKPGLGKGQLAFQFGQWMKIIQHSLISSTTLSVVAIFRKHLTQRARSYLLTPGADTGEVESRESRPPQTQARQASQGSKGAAAWRQDQ
jgi:hypothetical protein